MPRPLRDMSPGIRHIVGQSVDECDLLATGHDRRRFLDLLERTCKRYSLVVIAYCLMSTHYHLIVETTDEDVSRSLQWLNSRYAETTNALRGRRGHLYGARYWGRRILSDADLLTTTRYVALNPVRAGLCRRADEWPWSSYTALVRGLRRPTLLDPRRVFSLFDTNESRAIRRLEAFVEDELLVA